MIIYNYQLTSAESYTGGYLFMKNRNYLIVLGVVCLGAFTGCSSSVEDSVKTYGDSDVLVKAQEAVTSPEASQKVVASPEVSQRAVVSPEASKEAVTSPEAGQNAVSSPEASKEPVVSPKPTQKPGDNDSIVKATIEHPDRGMTIVNKSNPTVKATSSKTEILKEKEYSKVRISGISSDNTVVWYYDSEPFSPTEKNVPLKLLGDAYEVTYICEKGIITALDTATGNVRWISKEFSKISGENVSCFVPNSNGHIYVSGYYGPDFMELDNTGKTVKRIEHLAGDKYYWPLSMDITEGNESLLIYYQSNAKYVLLNLEDYSVIKLLNNQ